ncbi:MAG: DUF2309 domain-containing protein [Nitriliruptoraceae bacterium]|nr:DUF2309 domain-containing protein [Nitriliruptoraceae bacterium]
MSTIDHDTTGRSVGLLADVSRASDVVAPLWPLTAFVAVNPLGGLQRSSFEEATRSARRWFGARTHLRLEEFRADHARGRTTDTDLRRAILATDPRLGTVPGVQIDGRSVSPTELVLLDLLHGPSAPTPRREMTAGQRLELGVTDDAADAIDAYLGSWCAVHVDEAVAAWQAPDRDRGLFGAWHAVASHDRRLTRLVGRRGRAWIAEQPERAEHALDRGLQTLGVDEDRRVDELRAQLARVPGWAGYAHWYDEWAPADHPGAAFRSVELLALRVTLEAALVADRHERAGAAPVRAEQFADERHAEASTIHARTTVVLDRLGAADDPVIATGVRQVLELFPEDHRAAVWLAAQEDNFRDRLLALMPPREPGPEPRRPAAQAVFCIDVRSEGMRRHLESLGAYETLGFAGFFGVPMRWRGLGSAVAEARAPVLVVPRHEVAERPGIDPDASASYLARRRVANGAAEAFHAAKRGVGSPFALAEASGWLAGPMAALRTLAPGIRRPGIDGTDPTERPATAASVRAEQDPGSGFSLDERALFAETILRTMGMERFAPLVVLCGHGSRTVNNPHASSLDCGACGGAPGGASARVAAAILNDPEVRGRLGERGLSLPADTWFVAAEHDTASDTVTILDRALVPEGHLSALTQLEHDFAIAGRRLADERARRLPGDPSKIRERGSDWAQVRPEWGLAGNAAFVIGPRSTTADLDLASRVFLHSYEADKDPDGAALETIMTAPLVVGQWISAQYYFSTVDQDVFGAGDKTLHNPVGGIGVMLGESGDLQVGLPLQSVAVGAHRVHEPLRLLAVIEAPLERIEAIIGRNDVLRELIGGGWIHVVGRSHRDERWSVRSPGGAWATWWPAEDAREPTDVTLEVT